MRFVYGCFVLAARTAFPFAIIAFCHYKIAITLQQQQLRLASHKSSSTVLQQQQQLNGSDWERKRRLQRLLISMVLVFAICSFPLDIYNLLEDTSSAFQLDMLANRYAPVIFLGCHLLAMIGTLCNPVKSLTTPPSAAYIIILIHYYV